MTLKVVRLFVGEDAGCWWLSIVLEGDLGGGLGFVAIVLEGDLNLNSCLFYYYQTNEVGNN